MWGRANKSKACTLRFVEALNAHDLGGLAALMTEDFSYIDSWREGVEGREKVLVGLERLFGSDPEFGVTVEQITYRAPNVLMAGRITSAQFGDKRRAVWRISCDGERLSQWQSWADGGPPPMSRALSPREARDMSHRAEERPDIGGD